MKNTINLPGRALYCLLLFIPFFSTAQSNKPAVANSTKQVIEPKLVYGKYGCTASSYSGGSVTYTPRGSFIVTVKGTYTYLGFEKPSNGTYTVDKKGNLSFKGGYMNGGTAEKIDRPNKFFVVFPGIPDNRWTCGLVE
jgi:hypothetical protein